MFYLSVEKVTETIAKLNVTSLADREDVTLARRYVDFLDRKQKEQVFNLELLEQAEAQILNLWIESAEVTTLVDSGLIHVISEQYNAFNQIQKSFITNIDKLEELKIQLHPLQSIRKENYQKAKIVELAIDSIEHNDLADIHKIYADYNKLTSDQKAMVTNIKILKNAINQLEGKLQIDSEPSNIVYAGTRSSDYGIRGKWLGTKDWQYITNQMKDYFPHAQPTFIWIIGRLDTNVGVGGIQLEFEHPNDGIDYDAKNIRFNPPEKEGHLSHEEYLNYFDAHGIKVFLQVESGFADMKILMDLVLSKFGNHECVIGWGVDVEWYYGITEDAGIPVTDEVAQDWNDYLKSINQNYRMFLKHFNYRWLPLTYRNDLLFCNDSQGFGSLDGETGVGFIPEFKTWADHFYPNDVLYQIGYRADATWFYALEKPVIKNLGVCLAEVTKQNLGIAWVDFSIKDPLAFPELIKTDKELVNVVDSLIAPLSNKDRNGISKRLLENKATLTDSLYIKRILEIINSLTDSQRQMLNKDGLYILELIDAKKV